MKPLQLRLPPGAIQRGAIFPTKDPDYLTQDLLQVQLPGDTFIDVGWSPENDPSGEFVISVFRGCWERQLRDQQFTRDWNEVSATVQFLAEVYSSERVSTSCSTVSDVIWKPPLCYDQYSDMYCSDRKPSIACTT